MPSISIPCPSCGKTLKLKDESYLGKRIRCPGCQNTVQLPSAPGQKDDEVEIELVEDEVAPEPISSPRSTRAPGGRANPFEGQSQQPPAPEASPDSAGEILRRMIEEKKRRSRANSMLGVAILGVVCIAGAIAIPLLNNTAAPAIEAASLPQAAAQNGTTAAPIPVAAGVLSEEEIERKPDLLAEFRPTSGKPIDLRMVPDGVNLLIHLHPARIWADDEAMAELRATLTDNVTQWLEAKLTEHCRRPPSQIEEATFAIVLGPTGSEPQVSTVVRLVTPVKPSDFIDEFKGKVISDDGSARLVTSDKFYYASLGGETFAIGPVSATTEIQGALSAPNETIPNGVLTLVQQSDRERLVTVIFDIDDVRRHVESLFAQNAWPAVNEVLEWFGEDVSTVCWTGHVGDYFHSEFSFTAKGTRGGSGRLATSKVVKEELEERLPGMPLLIRGAVQKMNPQRLGFRNVIGRFPAMIQAYAMQTVFTLNAKSARMTTVLPSKAASNLALATLLTWDESTRTNFDSSAMQPVADAGGEKIPEKVEDRLRLLIDAEVKLGFEEAFRYILGEAKLNVEVDGPGIKLLGVTKNEPQNFNLGKVPAYKAIQAILLRPDKQATYKDIVFAIDEPNKKVYITSKDVAEEKKLVPFDIRGMK